MKQVQWFPGHMTKAIKEMKVRISQVDIVFELVDARVPQSSRNPVIDDICQNKPRLMLLNKATLADQKILNQWVQKFRSDGVESLKIDAISGLNLAKISLMAKEILKVKRERDARRGMKERPIRAMILGIPNVGKSTLINSLVKKKATVTGDRPGVTKAQQWIKLNEDLELLDTPGILWPKFEDERVGLHLAVTGAIKDDILPKEDVAIYALRFLIEHYPKALEERYKLQGLDMSDIEAIYNHIGRLRGCLIKNQEVDYDKVTSLILHDLRNKQLGAITLDRL